MAHLHTENLSLSYGAREIVRDLSFDLPEGKITVIVGANGSGKSTLLRGLSRLLRPRAGHVILDGRDIHEMRGKELAKQLGLLPQSPLAPEGVTVRELVSRGRFPHQGMIPQWRSEDEAAVREALAVTGTEELQDRLVDELSGGQRQRVWIAMALAQRTDVLLLDEPTTYLDITHQIEVLEVVRGLNRDRGTTVAMVLHDLNLAARYADHLVAVKDGVVRADGSPATVVTEDLVRDVFGLESRVIDDPVTGTPMVVPGAAAPAGASEAHAEPGAASAAAPAAQTALDVSGQLAIEATVGRIVQLSPHLVRFTFTSPDFEHAGVGVGAHPLDLRVKLIVREPSAATAATATGTTATTTGATATAPVSAVEAQDPLASLRPHAPCEPGEAAHWYKTWLGLDPETRGYMRTYTVRAQRAAGHPGNLGPEPEMDIDFVLHPSPSDVPGSGVASRWAMKAQVGERITLLCPNRHLTGSDYGGIAFRPGSARSLLLVGDETALPAIGSILDALGPEFTGRALIEIPEAADAQRLPTRSGIQVTWIAREGAPHGERLKAAVAGAMIERASCLTAESIGTDAERTSANAALQAAVRYTDDAEGALELDDIDVDTTLLWETSEGVGDFYAWIAGEAGAVKLLRRHLVQDLGFDRRQISFMGYWREGKTEN